MKKAQEESRLRVLLLKEKIESIEKDKQILVGQINQVVLEEAMRLNVPEGWHYEHEQGLFLSPEEMMQFNKEQEAQMQAQQQQVQINPA